MGVKNLLRYAKNDPDIYRDVAFQEIIDDFVEIVGQRQLVVAVDGYCMLHKMYGRLNSYYGGQWREFLNRIHWFVRSFRQMGVEPIFFFTGIERPSSNDAFPNCHNSREAKNFFKHLSNNMQAKASKIVKKPLFTGTMLRSALILECSCHVSSGLLGREEAIIRFAQENPEKCIAIIADKSEYIVARLPVSVLLLSCEQLDLQTMRTKLYDQVKLASKLGLDPKDLSLLGCLWGNDAIPVKFLTKFYLAVSSRCKSKSMLERVASFVLEIRNLTLPEIVIQVFGEDDDEKLKLLKRGLEVYGFLPTSKLPDYPELGSAVLDLASKKFECSQIFPFVYNYLLQRPQSDVAFFENTMSTSLPYSFQLFRPVRERVCFLLEPHQREDPLGKAKTRNKLQKTGKSNKKSESHFRMSLTSTAAASVSVGSLKEGQASAEETPVDGSCLVQKQEMAEVSSVPAGYEEIQLSKEVEEFQPAKHKEIQTSKGAQILIDLEHVNTVEAPAFIEGKFQSPEEEIEANLSEGAAGFHHTKRAEEGFQHSEENPPVEEVLKQIEDSASPQPTKLIQENAGDPWFQMLEEATPQELKKSAKSLDEYPILKVEKVMEALEPGLEREPAEQTDTAQLLDKLSSSMQHLEVAQLSKGQIEVNVSAESAELYSEDSAELYSEESAEITVPSEGSHPTQFEAFEHLAYEEQGSVNIELVALPLLVNGVPPSLEQLWCDPNCSEEFKWRCFLAAFDSPLDYPMFFKLLPSQRVVCALVNFLFKEIKSLELWEGEAIVCQFIHPFVNDLRNITRLKVDAIDPRGVHLGSNFYMGLLTAHTVLGAVGLPLNAGTLPWHTLDGKLFHHCYLKAKNNNLKSDIARIKYKFHMLMQVSVKKTRFEENYC